MNRRYGLIGVALVIISALVGGTFGREAARTSSFSSRHGAPIAAPEEALPRRAATGPGVVENAYVAALGLVSENYAGAVDYERVNQYAIRGMLATLDPHSAFFSRTEFNKLREEHESRIYGIGVNILRYRDGVYIVQPPIQNTPASRAGLRYGDLIVEVDGQDVREWTGDQVARVVRGERGTTVQLKIERPGALAPLHFSVVRDSVPLPSIRNYFMVRPDVGYVGLTGGFTSTSGQELRAVVAELRAQGMRQLVLDLRNNPGGLLDQAVSVAGEFLPRGAPVVSVRGREYNEPRVFLNPESDPLDLPLVVLINGNSASASEIVAGAIQDHGRGLVVGETSFGKGLVQRLFQLPYGTGLTLTTAKYYTPYGRLIQREYAADSFYDYFARHRPNGQDLAQPSPTPPATLRAPTLPAPTNGAPTPTPTPSPTPAPSGPPVTTAAGRVYYGGGGITPDVAAPPLPFTPTRGRIIEAAFRFTRQLAAGQIAGMENYRVEQTQYGRQPRPTDYVINDRVLEAFRDFVRRDEADGLTPALADSDLDFVRLRLREEIITAAFAGEAGGRILLESDPQLQRAIETLPEARRLAERVRSGAVVS